MIDMQSLANDTATLPSARDLLLPLYSTDNIRRLSFLFDKDNKPLRPTPHDELTGLPLCYVPRRDLPLPSAKPIHNDRLADWEHLVPRAEVALAVDNPVLQSDLGKAALVNARIQWVDFYDHHYIKNNYYRGPVHPQTEDAMTLYLLMIEAGYIPPEAIGFASETPKVTSLSQQDRQFLRESGQVRIACEGIVRKWLRQRVIEQNADAIIQDKWIEFLKTYDTDKKINLAHLLAAKLIEQVVEPFSEPYEVAKKDGLIPEHLPSKPRDFLKKKLFQVATHGVLINEMNSRFGRERRMRYPDGLPTLSIVA
jgi:hypothetical protein